MTSTRFTTAARDELQQALLAHAEADPRLTSGAVTGSYAIQAQDDWSDLDLAFGVRTGKEPPEILSDYDELMRRAGALDSLRAPWERWTYCVYLLQNGLQVDLAFVDERDFKARAPTFQLRFGDSQPPDIRPPSTEHYVRWGWLYALHARNELAREHPWRAEHYITGLRQQTTALICIRHETSPTEGRGTDALPSALKDALSACLVRATRLAELRRAYCETRALYLAEVRRTNASLSRELDAITSLETK